MSYTTMSASISAEEVIREFDFQCDHSSGGISFRLSPREQTLLSVYMYFEHPDELIQLAEILGAAAEDWAAAAGWAAK